ncbi:MAG: hypothetical protein KJ749_08930, partial [Planctomycetes bacterium]|nr:hypothetical protein [Planctomycetota bacterium]
MRNREIPTCSRRHGSVRIGIAGLIPALILAIGLGVPAVAANGDEPVSVRVAENSADRIVLEYVIGDYTVEPVMIDGGKYAHIKLGKESPLKNVGAPALPTVNRSIVIPNDARMEVRVLASSHHDVAGVRIAPSKKAEIAEDSRGNAFYPQELVSLDRPYILRDYRGTVLEVHPFQYNPVAGVLRVYTSLSIEVVKAG